MERSLLCGAATTFGKLGCLAPTELTFFPGVRETIINCIEARRTYRAEIIGKRINASF